MSSKPSAIRWVIGVLLAVVIAAVVYPSTYTIYVSELTGSQRMEIKKFGFVIENKQLWKSPLEEIDFPFFVREEKISESQEMLSLSIYNKNHGDSVYRGLKYMDDDDLNLLKTTLTKAVEDGADYKKCSKIITEFLSQIGWHP